MIKIQGLVGGYTNTPIINGVDLEINKGEFFALLGPNGSGKTTLFKLITGQLPINGGKISFSGKDISSLSKLEKAQKIAVLAQEVQVSFDFTVEEIISLGRYPHQKGLLKKLSKEDWKVIEDVMELTKINHFRKTQFRNLSGGEKQRVLLAKALAQEPEILLLDEPTNHLDIKHTFQLLDLLKERQQTLGLTILAILHDLNIASLYADRIALLHNGSFLDVGDVDILRKEEQLKKVYEVSVKSHSHPNVPKPQLLMTANYSTSAHPIYFKNAYKNVQKKEFIHIQFEQPLRTISNGMIGEGIQWLKHFCHFHMEKNYYGSDLKKDFRKWMAKYSIPHEQAVGVLSVSKPEDVVVITKEIETIQMMVIVTAGLEDAGEKTSSSELTTIGAINTMLFIDANFTDGALLNGYMAATEAKVRALYDLEMINPHSGASTDSLLLALTQQGKITSSAGSETNVGKAIGKMVYQATMEAIRKNLQGVH